MDANAEAIRALAAVPYFTGVNDDLVKTIAKHTIRQDFEAGQVVFLEGEQEVALYIVQTGWFKAVKTSPDGREQVLSFIGPGEVFNAIGVFVESANPATVIALEAGVALLPRDFRRPAGTFCPLQGRRNGPLPAVHRYVRADEAPSARVPPASLRRGWPRHPELAQRGHQREGLGRDNHFFPGNAG